MAKLFHILTRNAEGGLTTSTKEHLKEIAVDLEFKRPAAAKQAATILNEFRNLLLKSVRLPAVSPFLILRTTVRSGGTGPVAQCKCQCSVTNDCGGGGGGS
jgi:hypothetical protein